MTYYESETAMSLADWQAIPKDNFARLIRIWCFREGHVQNVRDGDTYLPIPGRLPYRRDEADPSRVIVCDEFLAILRRFDGVRVGRAVVS